MEKKLPKAPKNPKKSKSPIQKKEKLCINDCKCAVCYTFIVEPIKLKCKHFFCYDCLTKIDRLIQNQLKCPLCREITKNLDLKIDKNLTRKFQKKFPKTFKKAEKELKKVKILEKDKKKIYFRIGNSHELIEEKQSKNKHKWKLYLKSEENFQNLNFFFKKIEYILHQDFGDHIRQLKPPHFKHGNFYGWGTFLIPFKIYFQDWVKREDFCVEHQLSFEGDGKFVRFFVSVDKSCFLENKRKWEKENKKKNFKF